MAFLWVSGADFGCNRHCKTNPVDLEGSRGQVLVVLGGFWGVLGEEGGSNINSNLWPKRRHEEIKRDGVNRPQPIVGNVWLTTSVLTPFCGCFAATFVRVDPPEIPSGASCDPELFQSHRLPTKMAVRSPVRSCLK